MCAGISRPQQQQHAKGADMWRGAGGWMDGMAGSAGGYVERRRGRKARRRRQLAVAPTFLRWPATARLPQQQQALIWGGRAALGSFDRILVEQ